MELLNFKVVPTKVIPILEDVLALERVASNFNVSIIDILNLYPTVREEPTELAMLAYDYFYKGSVSPYQPLSGYKDTLVNICLDVIERVPPTLLAALELIFQFHPTAITSRVLPSALSSGRYFKLPESAVTLMDSANVGEHYQTFVLNLVAHPDFTGNFSLWGLNRPAPLVSGRKFLP